jgi:hypothetical protein
MNTARRQFGSAMTRRRIGVPTLYGRLPTARYGVSGSGASTASSLRSSRRSPNFVRSRAASCGSISMAMTRFGSSSSFRGQHAFARTDLDDDLIGRRLDRGHDFFDRAAVAQEVLAPLFLRACHPEREDRLESR